MLNDFIENSSSSSFVTRGRKTMVILNIQDKIFISLKHKYHENIKSNRLIGFDNESYFL